MFVAAISNDLPKKAATCVAPRGFVSQMIDGLSGDPKLV